MKPTWVIECCGLYVKKGGFTYKLSNARHYKTKRAALSACVFGWKVVKYEQPIKKERKNVDRTRKPSKKLP